MRRSGAPRHNQRATYVGETDDGYPSVSLRCSSIRVCRMIVPLNVAGDTRLDSDGPPRYMRQFRTGKGRSPIRVCHKQRTMVKNAHVTARGNTRTSMECSSPRFSRSPTTAAHAPACRCCILRKLSLDELPQLPETCSRAT
jgi:lipopolysaccharide/colanic/teichoic acid biosynthesis glycosyltransferase